MYVRETEEKMSFVDHALFYLNMALLDLYWVLCGFYRALSYLDNDLWVNPKDRDYKADFGNKTVEELQISSPKYDQELVYYYITRFEKERVSEQNAAGKSWIRHDTYWLAKPIEQSVTPPRIVVRRLF